ncbi:hypothetical protein ABZ690_30960, partial [Streptomyces sp. NPDC006967]|uniref:hypothetical protein n=1 Tax=Streptomyces sp. NPDC006967 TaxID=3156906 RepID=UPI000CD4EC99
MHGSVGPHEAFAGTFRIAEGRLLPPTGIQGWRADRAGGLRSAQFRGSGVPARLKVQVSGLEAGDAARFA